MKKVKQLIVDTKAQNDRISDQILDNKDTLFKHKFELDTLHSNTQKLKDRADNAATDILNLKRTATNLMENKADL